MKGKHAQKKKSAPLAPTPLSLKTRGGGGGGGLGGGHIQGLGPAAPLCAPPPWHCCAHTPVAPCDASEATCRGPFLSNPWALPLALHQHHY